MAYDDLSWETKYCSHNEIAEIGKNENGQIIVFYTWNNMTNEKIADKKVVIYITDSPYDYN